MTKQWYLAPRRLLTAHFRDYYEPLCRVTRRLAPADTPSATLVHLQHKAPISTAGSFCSYTSQTPCSLWEPTCLVSNGWRGGALFPGVKRPAREANNSFPFSDEVKTAWSYTFTRGV